MNSIEAKLCQGKDVFERMNYLYQASRFVATSSDVAASHYGNILVSCAKKAVLRMEPAVKRTICKNCHSPLLPGKTARIRLTSKPVKAIKWTCLVCMRQRKIPSSKSNKLWCDETESLVQMYDYTPKEAKPVSFTDDGIASNEKAKKANCFIEFNETQENSSESSVTEVKKISET